MSKYCCRRESQQTIRWRWLTIKAPKLFVLPFVLASLPSCAAYDYFFDVSKFCDPGQFQVQFVELATDIVKVKCMNEGQLDVLQQDSTVQILSEAFVKTNNS